MPDTKQQKVSLIKLQDASFLSLVKSPANRTGFKVVRSEDGTPDKVIRVKPKQSARNDSSLLAISFPAGITEDEAVELMEFFSLGDQYSVYTDDAGNYQLRREGTEDAKAPRLIEMPNGFSALVDGDSLTRSDNAVCGVTLVSVAFTSDSGMDQQEAEAWLKDHGIEYESKAMSVQDSEITVKLRECAEGEETRPISIADGITGLVKRSSKTEVPVKVYRSVVEQSYGKYGWGHLNFFSALADPEFTDKSWDAIYVLRDVLETIILGSGLPLDDRKTLVQNACDNFASYISGLMDTLPRGLIEKATTSSDNTEESIIMATKKDDAKKENESTAADEATGTENTAQFVTRDELPELITNAVAAAMAKHVERDEEETEEDADPTVAALAALADTVSKINSSVETISASVNTLQAEVAELGGETINRSDDEESSDTADDGESVQRGDGSPFVGMFGSRFSSIAHG